MCLAIDHTRAGQTHIITHVVLERDNSRRLYYVTLVDSVAEVVSNDNCGRRNTPAQFRSQACSPRRRCSRCRATTKHTPTASCRAVRQFPAAAAATATDIRPLCSWPYSTAQRSACNTPTSSSTMAVTVPPDICSWKSAAIGDRPQCSTTCCQRAGHLHCWRPFEGHRIAIITSTSSTTISSTSSRAWASSGHDCSGK